MFYNYIFLYFTAFGWFIFAFGILQLPFWAIYTILRREDKLWKDRVINAFKPCPTWGPEERHTNNEYQEFISKSDPDLFQANLTLMDKIKNYIWQ